MKKLRTLWKEHRTGCLVWAGVAAFLIAAWESWFYYESLFQQPMLAQNLLYRLLMVVENGIKAFTFEAKIGLGDVIKYMQGDLSRLRYLVSVLYVLAFFVAPLVTATALFTAVQFLVGNKLGAVAGRKKEKYLLVGYNSDTLALIRSLSGLDRRRYQLVLLVDQELNDSQKTALQGERVLVRQFSQLDLSGSPEGDRKNRRVLGEKRITRIFLMEKSAVENFTRYIFFSRLWQDCRKEGLAFGSQRLDVYCACQTGEVQGLIWNYQDHLEGTKPHLHLFSTAGLRVHALLEQTPLWSCNRQTGSRDLHLLILGFGEMGKKLFREGLNQGILASDSRVTIDIVDRDREQVAWALSGMLGAGYRREGDTLTYPGQLVDGGLTIRFHGLDVRSGELVQLVESLDREEPFTYMALCLPSVEQSLFAMTQLENYLSAQPHPGMPLAVRLDTCRAVTGYLNGDRTIHENVVILPGVDEVIRFQNIAGEGEAKNAEAVHDLYAGVEAGRTGSASREDIHQLLFRQESSYYQIYHRPAKAWLFSALSPEDQNRARQELADLCGEMEAIDRNPEEYRTRMDGINARILASPLLQWMGAVEHRRWSCYMLAAGWRGIPFAQASQIPKAQRIKMRVNPNLVSWDQLVKENPDVLAYDITPWQQVLEES